MSTPSEFVPISPGYYTQYPPPKNGLGRLVIGVGRNDPKDPWRACILSDKGEVRFSELPVVYHQEPVVAVDRGGRPLLGER